MLFIEFDTNIKNGLNILKYRNIDDNIWYYLYIDIQTLNLLLLNYGIISVYKIPTKKINCDNGTLSPDINLKYCGANIQLKCGVKNNKFYLADLEQNY